MFESAQVPSLDLNEKRNINIRQLIIHKQVINKKKCAGERDRAMNISGIFSFSIHLKVSSRASSFSGNNTDHILFALAHKN